LAIGTITKSRDPLRVGTITITEGDCWFGVPLFE
jgi:hypothetical protein